MKGLVRAVRRLVDRRLRTPLSLRHSNGDWWDKDQLGREGEALAARWLAIEGGCKVLYRNFRAPDGGEVDIVCRDDQTLVFAEVKTRTSDRYGRPAAAVTREKRDLVVRGAREWLRLLDLPGIAFRFDIIEVMLREGERPDVNWLPGAFHPVDGWRD